MSRRISVGTKNRKQAIPVPKAPQSIPAPKLNDHWPSVAIDFDGCLAAYDGAFDAEQFGEPNPGAIEAVRNYLAANFHVVILTTRADNNPKAAAQIFKWLRDNGLNRDDETDPGRLTITAIKLPAVVYIDDRGFKFEGRWPAPQEIKEFKPYWKKD